MKGRADQSTQGPPNTVRMMSSSLGELKAAGGSGAEHHCACCVKTHCRWAKRRCREHREEAVTVTWLLVSLTLIPENSLFLRVLINCFLALDALNTQVTTKYLDGLFTDSELALEHCECRNGEHRADIQ